MNEFELFLSLVFGGWRTKDKQQGDKSESEVKFRQISEAYDTLQNPEKRKIYDHLGKQAAAKCAAEGAKKCRVSAEELDFLFGSTRPGSRLGSCSDKLFGGLGKDLDLEQLFHAVHDNSCQRKRQRTQQKASASPFALARGKTVTVHGLFEAVELNGKKAQVQGYDVAKGRYDVKIRGEGPAISVKPERITQHCSVAIHGLTAQPQLNGLTADVVGFQPDTGKYAATLRRGKGSAMIFISPRNCILEAGTCIRLQGLSNPDLNGKMARVVEADLDAGRYLVQCSDGLELQVEYENALC